jgi:hypothetical protein
MQTEINIFVTIVPKAVLAEPIIVDGKVVVLQGELLSPREAHRHWKTYRQPMEFRCELCKKSIKTANIHKEEQDWRKRPYFSPKRKEDHKLPCAFAGDNQDKTVLKETSEVGFKDEVPTKLTKYVRKKYKKSKSIPDQDEPFPFKEENNNPKEIKHEEHTSDAIEDFCYIYFDRIKDCERFDFQGYKKYLADLPLHLPESGNVGYHEAFKSINISSNFLEKYRIFWGRIQKIFKCQNGYLISCFPSPNEAHKEQTSEADRNKKTVAIIIPKNILDEVDWGKHVESNINLRSIIRNPCIFICGTPQDNYKYYSISLESAYWVHFSDHPHNRKKAVINIQIKDEPYEVFLKTFTNSLNENNQSVSSSHVTNTNVKDQLDNQAQDFIQVRSTQLASESITHINEQELDKDSEEFESNFSLSINKPIIHTDEQALGKDSEGSESNFSLPAKEPIIHINEQESDKGSEEIESNVSLSSNKLIDIKEKKEPDGESLINTFVADYANLHKSAINQSKLSPWRKLVHKLKFWGKE